MKTRIEVDEAGEVESRYLSLFLPGFVGRNDVAGQRGSHEACSRYLLVLRVGRSTNVRLC